MSPAPLLRAGLLATAGLGAGLLLGGRPRSGLLALAAAHATFCATAAAPNHALTGPLIRRFTPRDRELWLTLDDGPDPAATPAILDVLERHRARATFLLIGKRAARHPDLVRAITAAGHEIGNHSHTHPAATFWTAGPARLAREIDDAQRAIHAAAGITPAFFRPPVGMANLFLDPLLRARGLRRLGWSVRAFDTRPQDPAALLDRLTAACYPGAIVLLHERGATAGPAILDAFLTRLRRAEFRVTLPAEAQLLVDSLA